ncbi:DUF1853 family protein [Paraburkholderia bonniea]|uniref:DUF1853 family protein n=1 Tax=Paraburkholderia bonniea TaxID=2152891 RepID=UPI0012914E4D|nr:DUF1853 family protein [Paraburkholderia bonniea]WJF89231.1 DUF1853 family protein [Paraburkholderia bonniea]WJF92547.1 DUF1853 family protein [Paraburkholderia bonniea]
MATAGPVAPGAPAEGRLVTERAAGFDAWDMWDAWDAWRAPQVRDLAWLLFSPGLLRSPAASLTPLFETPAEAAAARRWLQALEVSGATGAAELQQHLEAARVSRLGRYAEFLLAWYLKHGPGARLVAANVTLRRGGVTLGECDFLVQMQSGERQHWELAVKCYLHVETGRAQLMDYVGPNLQDRFDRKLTHLLEHQLPLSARAEFAALGYRGPWVQRMRVHGWLFYYRGVPCGYPESINPEHARGWWITRAEWPAWAAAHAGHWRVLRRLEWLAPRCYAHAAASEAEVSVTDSDALALHFVQHAGPTMVAVFGVDDTGREIEHSRGFVVADDWPDKARAFAQS